MPDDAPQERGFSYPPQPHENTGQECPPSQRSAFLDPREAIEQHKHHLPHWQQGEVFIFVTWRLADSLPVSKINSWKAEREIWMKHHPTPWDTASEKEYHQRFSSQINDWLDQGFGSCLLQEPRLANIIANAFYHFDQQRYKLSSFVIMPNHIHVLFQPLQKHRLPQIIKSWKGFTANHINRLTGSKGSLWQEDYWDRLIRNARHFAKCQEYIRNNPGKARLHKSQYLLYENINNSHGF